MSFTYMSQLNEKSKPKKKKYTFPSLTQGNHYSNRKTNLEGFADMSDTNEMNLTNQTKEVIRENTYANKQSIIQNLREIYNTTLEEYNNVLHSITENATKYIKRINPNNIYLNKVISFSNNVICYVTNKGLVKPILTPQIWKTLRISQTVQIPLNIQWLKVYDTSGTPIPTNPPLISGTPVTSGQSLGNEGENVFVGEFLSKDVVPSYMGCYTSNNLEFIGGSPPKGSSVKIQNGTFSQPSLSTNSYKEVTGSSLVPGWYFGGAVLLNNSAAWGIAMPYPSGNQCVAIQNKTYINTTLNLELGITYTITFSGCSRDCCLSSNTGNPINVQLYTSLNAFISTIANFTPTPINTWKEYSYTFTVPSTQNYNIYFSGTNASGDQTTAITNVSLSSEVAAGGQYSFTDCETAAITSGYQYFGLQNVNAVTGNGYCAVSNSEPAITQKGGSTVPTKYIPLWSSNTFNQQGNTAMLSVTGSLQVINSNGQSVYSSPSSAATPSNYYGCYGDKSSRAMISYDKSKSKFTNAQCQQLASKKGYKYYGLQNISSESTAQCSFSNDLSQSMKYGSATNCTKMSDGTWSGGGWSNAIYNTLDGESNYFIILQDDGNAVIYRGTSPSDNQGVIWSTQTNGKQNTPNPSMTASLGKYGKNWMASGSTLSPGDFIGSTNGDIVLIMQSDGNLVLYTFQMTENCQKMSDGHMGGGMNANAMYSIGAKSVPQNMGHVAYVDADANLHAYSSSNTKYAKQYSVFSGTNATGNDLANKSFANATVSSCKIACDNNVDCAGFVFDTDNSVCYPKSREMYPYGNGTITAELSKDTYIKNKLPSRALPGIPATAYTTDTFTYQNYVKKGDFSKDTYKSEMASSLQKNQLEQLKTKMNLLTNQMSTLTGSFQKGSIAAEEQAIINATEINKYVDKLTQMSGKIDGVNQETTEGIQNILNDSDITVLQKNYNYLFWSILAAGTVMVSINIVKQ
jgi:hypothetical protein